jgi:hypothetical protein
MYSASAAEIAAAAAAAAASCSCFNYLCTHCQDKCQTMIKEQQR